MNSKNIEQLKTFEQITEPENFEQMETEKKFLVTRPALFDELKNSENIVAIEQIYLSAPDDEFNLRLRESTSKNGIKYTATMKSRGESTEDGLARLETEVNISSDTYAFYAQQNYARLHKLRLQIAEGTTIDWVEGYNAPIVEIEDFGASREALAFYDTYAPYLEGVPAIAPNWVDNEWIAHHLSHQEKEPQTPLTAQKIADEILAYHDIGLRQVVVSIAGRSGSGKSTMSREVAHILAEKNPKPTVTYLSTDDYHRGKTWLDGYNKGEPWQNWDDEIVYDTKALAEDIEKLKNGEPIPWRHFDFGTQEPSRKGSVYPDDADVIIIEGIQAGSPDLSSVRNAHFELPTSLATCIGRDLARIRNSARPNSSIGDAKDRLRYQLEVAEPTYRQLEKPSRNSWPAYAPKLGSVAWRSATEEC